MAAEPTYPFTPKSNAQLRPGQFWDIPLSDGRFACGRVVGVDRDAEYGARTSFIGALLDWVGATPPDESKIAGARPLEVASAHVKAIERSGGQILGFRPLRLDGIESVTEVGRAWGLDFVRLRAERRFVEGNPPPEWAIREIRSPLSDEMLVPFESPQGVVQFTSLLNESEFQRLAEWMSDYPHLTLRVYGPFDERLTDLEFLKFFPFVRHFAVELHHSLQTLDGLRHLPPDCESLGIGSTKARLDLSVLQRFSSLRSLYIEGPRGVDVVAELASLEELTLHSVTLPDLSLLLPLENLLALDIKLGGIRNLELLPKIGHLRYVELWMVKGLSDLSPVAELPHLRYLFLQSLRQISQLPNFAENINLRRVHLESMKGLRDLAPLATAPSLEELLLLDMNHLKLSDIECLRDSKSLKAVTFALGGIRKTEAAEQLLGLPGTDDLKIDWRKV